jgi:thiol:disulfide interchange protein DsbD
MLKNIKLITIFLLIGVAFTLNAQISTPVKWNMRIESGNTLVFHAQIAQGWHLYDLNLPEGGPLPTVFNFDKISGARLEGKVETKTKIISQYDNTFKMDVRWFAENPTFTQRLTVSDRQSFVVEGHIDYMACNDENCIPATEEFRFTSADLPPITDKTTIEKPQTEKQEQITAQEQIEKQEQSQDPSPIIEADSSHNYWTPVIDQLAAAGGTDSIANLSWLYIFVAGFVGGLLALLTPCVWPIIPMTVSFFLKRSKSNRRKAIADAAAYGLSIVVIYLLLGLLITVIFDASALNAMSTGAVFNLLFFGLLVLFAISFFGAFDLVLPSSWTNRMDSRADATTGLLSIFFMAFTLVLVSFSCTGPIIGTLLVEAAGRGSLAGPAIGMFGFALALALPFTFFAIFPSLLQNLPKSGGWLNSVKITLGFLELALALKFLSVADLAYGWHILDREVFLVLWIVIFTLLGLYLLGIIRFAHDEDMQRVSVPRLFLAIVSLAFSLYLVPGLWGAPLKAVSAFSPPLYTQDFSLYEGEVRPKYHDFDEGMDFARRNRKPVLIDFTGYGCVNCREMEAAVWSDPRVKTIIDNDYVLISLYVDDKTPLPETVEVSEAGKTRRLRTVGDRWSYLQRSKFGANAQPFYVLLDNDGLPLGPARAYNRNIDDYIRFLQDGKNKFNKQ